MSNVLSYASFAIAIAAMVVASQSAVGEKQESVAGTQAFVTNSPEPVITPASVYYPSQFVNKAKFVEREYPQF